MIHIQGKKILINGLSDNNRIQTHNHLLRKTNTQPFSQFYGRKKKENIK